MFVEIMLDLSFRIRHFDFHRKDGSCDSSRISCAPSGIAGPRRRLARAAPAAASSGQIFADGHERCDCGAGRSGGGTSARAVQAAGAGGQRRIGGRHDCREARDPQQLAVVPSRSVARCRPDYPGAAASGADLPRQLSNDECASRFSHGELLRRRRLRARKPARATPQAKRKTA